MSIVSSSAKIINLALASSADLPKSIRVGNLPRIETSITDELREIFGRFGSVRDVYVPTASDGRPASYGFIEFRNPGNALRAVSFYNEGCIIGNRLITVQLAESQRKSPAVMTTRGSSMKLYDRVKYIMESERMAA